jgi:hypothetical protein
VAKGSDTPWKIIAIVLLVLIGLFLIRWIFSIVWWLAGTAMFLLVVGAIVWAIYTVTRKR